MYNNTTGNSNTAVGVYAMQNNTSGHSNTAFGREAMQNKTTGNDNTGIGYWCMQTLTTGAHNHGMGRAADCPSATGSGSFTLGDGNVNNLRCNDTSISGLSDQRDKAEITDLPEVVGLDLINKLRPVTYFWDRREWYDDNMPDGSKIKREWRKWKMNSGQKMGFIAQEVQTAIEGEKCLEDSMIVITENLDKLEFAPAHLITPLVKAVQQLSSEVEILKSEIAILKGE
jgi:hypothetical protein